MPAREFYVKIIEHINNESAPTINELRDLLKGIVLFEETILLFTKTPYQVSIHLGKYSKKLVSICSRPLNNTGLQTPCFA